MPVSYTHLDVFKRQEQSFGVLMRRMIENGIRCAPLTDTATVHDNILITHTCNNTQIMGYHDDRHTELLLQDVYKRQDIASIKAVDRFAKSASIFRSVQKARTM